MLIKELLPEEIEQAKEIYCKSFQKKYIPSTLNLTGTILGCYLENQLIGIAQIDYINNIFENKKIAWINSFCIHPNYQNQGYGDIFLKKCIKYLQEKEVDFINMTSNPTRTYAHKLYTKNSFETVNTILFKKNFNK